MRRIPGTRCRPCTVVDERGTRLSPGASKRPHTATEFWMAAPTFPVCSRVSSTRPLAVVLALLLLGSPAFAGLPGDSCQAGGSLITFLDPPDLERGFPIKLLVNIHNTSTTNPGMDPVTAELIDDVRIILACADTNCVTQLPGVLTFVSCDPVAGIASCALDPAQTNDNVVLIEPEATGFDLNLNTNTLIATINAIASQPVPSNVSPGGVFFVRGGTNQDAIQTTDDRCEPPVTGNAGGSTNAVFPVAPFVEIEKTCSFCDANSDPANQSEVEIEVTNTGGSRALQCTVRDIFDPGGANTVIFETVIEELAVGETVQFGPFPTPPHADDVVNRATVQCAEVGLCDEDPECQTEDAFSTTCFCEPPSRFCPPLDKARINLF